MALSLEFDRIDSVSVYATRNGDFAPQDFAFLSTPIIAGRYEFTLHLAAPTFAVPRNYSPCLLVAHAGGGNRALVNNVELARRGCPSRIKVVNSASDQTPFKLIGLAVFEGSTTINVTKGDHVVFETCKSSTPLRDSRLAISLQPMTIKRSKVAAPLGSFRFWSPVPSTATFVLQLARRLHSIRVYLQDNQDNEVTIGSEKLKSPEVFPGNCTIVQAIRWVPTEQDAIQPLGKHR
jgi:hypothetical protein